MNQVHKEDLKKVENALENRSDPSIEIFGTEGIPEDIKQSHKIRVTQHYYDAAAARQAKTGNPQPGSNDPIPKRPKLEDEGDLKKKLAEWRAQKAAAAQAKTNGASEVPAPFQNGYPQQYPYQQGQQPYGFQPPNSASPGTNGGIGQPPGLPQRPPMGGAPGVPQTQPATQDPRLQARNDAAAARAQEPPAPSAPETAPPVEPTEKKSKREKPTRMIYSAGEDGLSPEEKMATMSTYSDIDMSEPVVLGNTTGAVAGAVDDDESAVGRRE